MKKTLPKSMERFLAELKEKAAAHPQWMEQFYTCYANTLDTTVKKMEDGTVHVITGDIPGTASAICISGKGGCRNQRTSDRTGETPVFLSLHRYLCKCIQ